MKNTLRAVVALAVPILVLSAAAQEPGARQGIVSPAIRAAAARITAERLKGDLEFLASDELKGRNTPSPGFDAAAAYIEKRLQRAGVKPLGDSGTYRQHYTMRETTLRAGEASIAVGDRTFKYGDDFTLRSFAGELITQPVRAVYVGHGWTAEGLDPYSGIDVKGKIVLVHAFNARPRGAKIRQLGRVTIGGTSPIVAAHERGALAIVYLASTEPQRGGGRGARPMVRRELEPGVPSAYAAPLMTSIQLGERATQTLLHGTPLDPSLLAEQTKAQAYPASFELPAAVTLRLPATSVLHRPFNVVGLVEGTDPALKNEYIVVQSHLDGAVGSRTVDGDAIYNSADDNATGSAANLSIAEQMAAVRPGRSLIFVWDSGEEQGLWGTRQFVSTPPVPLANIVAMINIDMIGANRAAGSSDAKDDRVTGPNEVFLIGPGVLSDAARALVERVNDNYLKLSFNRKYDTPESEFFYPRTDAGPFLERHVLTIGFTTGLHGRYHLPADEARFLDVGKMTSIARTVFAVVHALAETPERPRIEKPIPPTVLQISQAALTAQNPLQDVDGYVEAGMAEWQIPGLAVAVVKDDKVVFLRGYGVRQVGRDARVDEQTIFPFGSLTKAFTAFAVALLVDEGKLAWDDRVTKHLPWLEFADSWVTRNVTVRDLLSHRVAGGWGGSSYPFVLVTGTPWDEALKRMRHLGGDGGGFRSRYEYDNANYWTAGKLVEAASGQQWREFVRSRILVPVGMTSATTNANQLWHPRAMTPCSECGLEGHIVSMDDARVQNIAVPHHIKDNRVMTAPVYDHRGDPSGAIHGSIADAAQWLRLQLGKGAFNGKRMLRLETFAEMHAPQMLMPPDPHLASVGGNPRAYGFAWNVTSYRGRKAVMHGGGFATYIGFLPEERLGVVVLGNVGTLFRQALVFHVFDAYLGAPGRDWSQALLEETRLTRERTAAQRARAAAEQPPRDETQAPLSTYVGVYTHPAFGDILVQQVNGKLVLRFVGGQVGDLERWGKDRFRANWRGPDQFRTFATFSLAGVTAESVTLQFPAATFRRPR